MRTLSRSKWIFITLLVMLISLILAVPVFAEGEVPADDGLLAPEENTPEEELPVEEAPAPPAADPPVAEQPPDEEVVVEEDVVIPEGIPVELAPEAPASADLAPMQNFVEPSDAACEETADPASNADPYFTVGTQTYRWLPMITGDCSPYTAAGEICTLSATPIQDAINYIKNNATIPTDRKIYVESDTYNESVLFDGTNPNLSTLNGLIGVSESETTIINGNVTVHDLTSGFTLQGFTIIGGVDFYSMTGTVTVKDVTVKNSIGDGITVENSYSAVVIDDVTANGNAGNGLDIINDDNGLAYNVTIKNSHFDDNEDSNPSFNVYGVKISTLGKIIIDGITVNRNRGGGIYLQTDFASLSIKNAILSENDASPDNFIYGFELLADSTRNAPITIENMIVQDINDPTYASVALYTAGNVLIRNLYINGSSQGGLLVSNIDGFGSVKVYDSQFSDNTRYGAFIESKGSVYISSIKAINNGEDGLYIDNCQNAGGCTGTGTVTITSSKTAGLPGVNDFSWNGDYGLNVQSAKAIYLTNVIANGNGADGICLANNTGSGGITVTKNLPSTQYFTFYNMANANSNDGIDVESTGTIRIEYLLAEENTYQGGNFNNEYSTSTPGVIIRYGEFNNNDYDGLNIETKGAISLTNVSASGNNAGPFFGAYLYTLNGISGGVTIKGIGDYTCMFNNNGAQGIAINALGHVVLSNIESSGNTLNASIFNDDAASAKNISITNGVFNDATSTTGINIVTKGSVLFNTVTANNNPRSGAVINAWQGFGNVTIKNSEFNRNNLAISDNAVEIYNKRNVTLFNISVSDNGYRGIHIDNCQWDGYVCQGSGSVSIRSSKGFYNTFSNNGDTGVLIETKGSVTLYNIIALNNEGIGVEVDNNDDETSGNIIISASSRMRSSIGNNSASGLYIRSKGNITVNYLDVFNNGGYGSLLDNSLSNYNKYVKVKESTFVMNEDTGLDVNSKGTITIQGVDASDNSVFNGNLDILGEWIIEMLSHTRGFDYWTFTADGVNNNYDVYLESEFFDAYLELRNANGKLIDSDDNSGGGTIAHISGVGLTPGDYTITVRSSDGTGGGQYRLKLNTELYFSQEDAYGANLENMAGTGAVKILYSSKVGYGLRVWNNNYTGLYINSAGTLSLSRIEAYYNGSAGIYALNYNAPELPATINTASAEGSPFYGVFVSSHGNITLKNVTSIGNLDSGARLRNDDSAPAQHTIKVYSSTFLHNAGGEGLEIDASGAVLLSNIVSINPNGSYGVGIDNTYGTGNVTITGKENIFDENGSYGLHIVSHGGISLTNFSASNNGTDGVYAYNGYGGFDPKFITINNTQRNAFNMVNDNGQDGLDLYSYGAVTINKTMASGNPYGSAIDNFNAPSFQTVKVSNSIFNDSSAGSLGTGLDIEAYGPVSLTNIWASFNSSSGIFISNPTAAGQDVILSKITTDENGSSGVTVYSSGFVKLNTMNASGNQQSGVWVDNSFGTEGAYLSNGNLHGNTFYGFYIYTNNLIQISNVSANYNKKQGIYVNGDSEYIDVTLYKVKAMGNTYDGIRLDDVKTVNANYVTSVLNGSMTYNSVAGIYIASQPSVDSEVTIKNSTFMANYGNGVFLLFMDIKTITNTIIFGNDLDGSGEGETNF